MALGGSGRKNGGKRTEARPAQLYAGTAGSGGFLRVGTEGKRRLVIGLYGMDKEGKNHIAFTAPGPIFIQSTDLGLEGMVEKFVKQGKEIHQAIYSVDVMDASDVQAMYNAAHPVWEKYIADYYEALAKARTVVWDTETETWELARLAEFGTTTPKEKNRAFAYGPVNAQYRRMLRAAYDKDVNLILLQKMRDEYVNDKKTGGKERKGFNDIPYIVQVNARAWREPFGGDFHLEITNCRQNQEIEGMDIVVTDNKTIFATLGQLVYPDSEEGEWL